MVLSSPNRIFDPIRKIYLLETPEEKVRQAFLKRLLESGFPEGLICLEARVQEMTRAIGGPKRRADILCFTKAGEKMEPLLLVECKAVKITKKTEAQILGYNYFIRAKYLCMVNQKELFFGIADQSGRFHFQSCFYSYQQLLQLS